MEDVRQIIIGGQKTGILGLKDALEATADQCQGKADDHIREFMVGYLSKQNYIQKDIKPLYAEAFLREYKKYIGEPVDNESTGGLQIKVLGPGCPQCERLEQEVMTILAETGIVADLEHVRDLAGIGAYGVMGSPALVINDKVKAVGTVPSKTKIKAWMDQIRNSDSTVSTIAGHTHGKERVDANV